MYVTSSLPKPLKTPEFYILLVLADTPLHRYAIKGAISNASLDSVQIKDGNLYPMLERLRGVGFVDMVSLTPAGKSGKERLHYQTSEHGLIRLQEEAQRLRHAVAIMERLGLFQNNVPTDIQRIMLNARVQLGKGDSK